MAIVKSINLGNVERTPAQPPWVITTHDGDTINLQNLGDLATFAKNKAHQIEALMSCVTAVNDIHDAEAVLPMVYGLAYQMSLASGFLEASIASAGKEVPHV